MFLTLTSEPRANVERYEHGAKPRRRAALNDWLETRCRELWNQTRTARILARLPKPGRKKRNT
jgi:hypothetical protein